MEIVKNENEQLEFPATDIRTGVLATQWMLDSFIEVMTICMDENENKSFSMITPISIRGKYRLVIQALTEEDFEEIKLKKK